MRDLDPVKALVKHVGRGKTLARDLSATQAQDAVGRILRGEFTDAQLGAFLQAMRIKETSVEELREAARGCLPFLETKTCPSEPGPEAFPLVVNLAFDTARKGGVLSLPAVALLRRAGLAQPLVVWEPPVLFPAADPVGRTLEALRAHPWLAEGECSMIAVGDLLPAWKTLRRIRAELGFRSILNTLEKLLRPWSTCPVVVGISHDTFSERLCHVLHGLGAPRGAVVQGHHGTCDLTFGEKPLETTVWNGESVQDRTVVVSDLFPGVDSSLLLLGGFDAWPSQLRDPSSPLWQAVRAQAAYLLSVARGIELPEAAALVSQATDSLEGVRP
jgi:anthranilate phosphoribosyltransferase